VAQPGPGLRARLGARHRWGPPAQGTFFQARGGWGDTGAGHPSTSASERAARASRDRDTGEQRAGNWVELNLEEESDEEMDLDMGEINPHSSRWRYRNERGHIPISSMIQNQFHFEDKGDQ
jgi:hypothetical protein